MKKTRSIYPLLTLSAFFWGATFNLAKYSVRYLSAPASAALRFTLAAVVISLILVPQAGKVKTVLKQNKGIFTVLALLGVFGFNTFFFLGMRFTSPTNGSLIQATNPLVTALIAAVFFKEKISGNHKLGTSISFAGVAALILTGSVQRLQAPNIGDICCLVANICFAFYAVLQKRHVKNSTPIITTGMTTIIGFVPLWVVAAAVTPRPTVTVLAHLPWQVYGALVFMGALGSVLAYVFWSQGIARIGVADTAVFFHLVPVFTVLVSFILGQQVTLLQVAAGVVVMSGVVISSGTHRKLLAKFKGEPAAVVPATVPAAGSPAAPAGGAAAPVAQKV
ncbi:DMT family transporter [Kitasatospora sp. NBC_01287]|uniref:DMT family transporter n=1 Tax=Kitasatospora sp. NBC_01287 TaxID=2903573 RepID=UPI0022579E4D|nr:DMT family transporter [Kitasatospora sp. NBC_01287]MCX4746055.1 DMT family transporter [Kitasatospora sp. NBC_01287]